MIQQPPTPFCWRHKLHKNFAVWLTGEIHLIVNLEYIHIMLLLIKYSTLFNTGKHLIHKKSVVLFT